MVLINELIGWFAQDSLAYQPVFRALSFTKYRVQISPKASNFDTPNLSNSLIFPLRPGQNENQVKWAKFV